MPEEMGVEAIIVSSLQSDVAVVDIILEHVKQRKGSNEHIIGNVDNAAGEVDDPLRDGMAVSVIATFVEAGVRHSAISMGLIECGHIMLEFKGGRVPVRICSHDDVGKVLEVIVEAWTGLDNRKTLKIKPSSCIIVPWCPVQTK
jgi:hypothetical protein